MASSDLKELEKWLKSQIVGQASLVQRLIIALLADGHLLVEGAPGLAKTRAIKSLSEGIEADFHRIQFKDEVTTLASNMMNSVIKNDRKSLIAL